LRECWWVSSHALQLETLTVAGDEQLPDLNVLTAKLPPDVGSVYASLKVDPQVSGAAIS